MKRAVAFIPIVALALIVLISAALLIRGGPPQTITAGQKGRPAPAYVLTRLGGGDPVTNAETAGRTHVINMFASWCTPCRAEHAQLLALQRSGVEIVGVAYKDQPMETARFLDEMGNPYREVAFDPDGRFGLQLGIAGVPETFVIGGDGKIRAVHRGPLTLEIVNSEIMPALRAR